MPVTTNALAVKKPIWMLGDAEFDMLDWHDRLLEQRGGECRLFRITNVTRMNRSISTIGSRIRRGFRGAIR